MGPQVEQALFQRLIVPIRSLIKRVNTWRFPKVVTASHNALVNQLQFVNVVHHFLRASKVVGARNSHSAWQVKGFLVVDLLVFIAQHIQAPIRLQLIDKGLHPFRGKVLRLVYYQ